MSTLTTSPSPAVSPRASGLSQFASQRRSSNKSVLHSPASVAPSVPAQHSSNSKPYQRSPRPQPPIHEGRSQYSDAGTQYSPEGFPPTDRRGTTSEGRSAQKKRKESTPPLPSMISRTDGSEAENIAPPEPVLRETPAKIGDGGPSQELPERPAPFDDHVRHTTVESAVSKRARTSTAGLKVMPVQYETCNAKDLGTLIANMLMELIRLNDNIPLRDGKLTRFHSRAPPGISCHDYLLRLIQHATLSPPILLSMVYYIDRLCALYPAFTISSLTVHRFLITAATVASKGLSDSFWTNPTYARIGGISTSELATLELDFLQRVQFRIVPKPETLVDYYRSLVERSEGYVLEVEVQKQELGIDNH